MRSTIVAAALAVMLAGQFAPAQSSGTGTSYALLVACEKYDEKQLKPLKYTRNDIRGFQNILLESGFKANNIVLMHDEQTSTLRPEVRKVRQQLRDILAKVKSQDTIIIGLSGHGVQFKGDAKHYFCPTDADLEERNSLLAMDDLYKQLGECKAKRKLLVVDACRNDPQSRVARTREKVELESITRPQEEPVPEGIVALFSCSKGQESFEDPDLSHGIFFYHLMKGWHGAAVNREGEVTVEGLIHYVARETEKYARTRFRAAQMPQQKNEFNGSWTLSRHYGEIRRMTGPNSWINSVQISKNGRWVVCCTRGDGHQQVTADDPNSKRPEVFVWDSVTGQLLKRYTIRAGIC